MQRGVGKTYAMLEAAHEAKRAGRDVVVGYVERHSRPDTLGVTGWAGTASLQDRFL